MPCLKAKSPWSATAGSRRFAVPESLFGSPGTLGYALSVMGDGKRYKMNLRTEDTFDGVNYQAEFQPQAGQWIEARVPLSAFVPNFRGRPVPGAPPLNPALVRQVGLMIAGWQAGPFRLCVRRISAY
jgi:NADH dehydrogenase [ubiquinone] 1 alpha subcomplex assembly factor 1